MIRVIGLCTCAISLFFLMSLKGDEASTISEVIDWLKSIQSQEQNCKECPEFSAKELNSEIFVLMSFSVPDSIWLSLSQELEGNEGVFVLRGLPNDSFADLAKHLGRMKKNGMDATVVLNPKLFRRFGIECVPTFLIKQEDEYHFISGNVSLAYAKERVAKELNKEGGQGNA